MEHNDQNDRNTLSQQIKHAMKHQRLSMRSLSEVTDIPYGTLQGYLMDRHPMPAGALARVAKALEVSADLLIFARPATMDKHCLAIAIASLDDIKSAASKTGTEMSLLAQAQLFSDFYGDEYCRLYRTGEDGADPSRRTAQKVGEG